MNDRPDVDEVLGITAEYDPESADDYESLLYEFNVKLIEEKDPNKPELEDGRKFWGFSWKFGSMGDHCAGTVEEAKQEVALWCYLWLKGCGCGLSRDLAYCYFHRRRELTKGK